MSHESRDESESTRRHLHLSGVWRLGLLTFRWVVTTDVVLFALAIVIVGGSFYASVTTGAWHWFQRSGAIMASIGAVLSTRPFLRSALNAMLEGSDVLAAMRGSPRVPRPQAESDFTACFVGFWLVGIGTLTWAYGDLLGWLF